MSTRPAQKAHEWYNGEPVALGAELDDYLSNVPDSIDDLPLPIPGARIIIAPHAGYRYSGPCAAWAYKTLDLSKAKRIFLLGPSHTYYLDGCAVTTFHKYATPFGDLTVDRDTIQRVKEAAEMHDIPKRSDTDEHSLEMHLPYLYKRLQQTFGSPDNFPPIVPILIGDNDKTDEKNVGRALASYLKDPENAFIVSSDFCHWGRHFSYTVYSQTLDPENMVSLSRGGSAPEGPPIHETIRVIDEAAMDAMKSGRHDAFFANLKQTKNTVCGRHPIGVTMAGLEVLRQESGDPNQGLFKVIQYQRSQLVETPADSSVSYVSAYAIP